MKSGIYVQRNLKQGLLKDYDQKAKVDVQCQLHRSTHTHTHITLFLHQTSRIRGSAVRSMSSSNPHQPTRIPIRLTEENPMFRDSGQTADETLHEPFDRQKFTEAQRQSLYYYNQNSAKSEQRREKSSQYSQFLRKTCKKEVK